MSSDDESEPDELSLEEKTDLTLDFWNELLEDSFPQYYGLDKVSSVDILAAYEKKIKPHGYYTLEEHDAFYSIASTLQDYSPLDLHFKTLFNSVIALQ